MINITSFIQELEPIPYKLVRFDDNTYCGPKGNMMSESVLDLMVFETGKIIGTSKHEIYLPGSSETDLLENSLVIGKTNNRLVGPMIKYDTRGGVIGPFFVTKMRYYVEDEVAVGKGMWEYWHTGNNIERILVNIQKSKPKTAFFDLIEEEPLLGFDGESKELIEEIKDKADSFQKSLRMYKRY